ncbi:DUF4270 domain-containing protein [Flavobacterium sharifuzzamanii]|uniref:DUF4270 domain-containing protein n=1 Tax=Flavobacterium sharifuzzamanii TaxID=2211133 RepID=UPI000DAEE67F|nr:DUF4270 domain-containing protein [Flavobacterium sharifuzzamanii]KAF2080448.1 DUF4270 domain-containing protein [Flavobacterium sharifuzzamanii]
MYKTSFFKKSLLAVLAVFLYSCDKDFNAIGDGLVGDDHFGLESEKYDVIAFNQEVTPIQSNNMTPNALGIFDNPLFGTTTANFVTQVGLTSYAPTIGASAVIDSVKIEIPYFSHITATDKDGNNTYELDSIYGDKNGKLKLSVYESGIQMRSSYFSGGNQLPQFYYTDQNTEFSNKKVGERLNNGGVLENDEFYFNAKEIVTKTTDPTTKVVTTDRKKPQMTLHLNKQFFQDKILNAAASKLSSEDVFQEYFRGLYFNVEKSGSSPSNMALMNFSEGKITIYYKAKTESTADADDAMEIKKIEMGLKGASATTSNTANFLDDVRNPEYVSAITANVNKTEGDEKLYLKGGQGSLAIIKLFNQTDVLSYNSVGVPVSGGNGVPDELDEIRSNVVLKNWKVNEANLVFYIDAAKMAGTEEPNRVYLYNLTNNTVLADYSADASSAYGGLITVGSDKRGTSYKIRITSHFRNLIKDATAKNVDLGLVVSQSATTLTFNALKNKIQINDNPIEYFSAAARTSVMNPLGTVLFGGKKGGSPDSEQEKKRLKLEVYYTKPN